MSIFSIFHYSLWCCCVSVCFFGCIHMGVRSIELFFKWSLSFGVHWLWNIHKCPFLCCPLTSQECFYCLKKPDVTRERVDRQWLSDCVTLLYPLHSFQTQYIKIIQSMWSPTLNHWASTFLKRVCFFLHIVPNFLWGAESETFAVV